MTIYLGADHAGFELKEKVKKYLEELGYEYQDLGNIKMDPDDDYPDFALKVAKTVRSADDSLGILICGIGVGMCIVANKIKGIRAGIAWDDHTARKAREDDDTNILCLAGRVLDGNQAKKVVKIWLETKPSTKERYLRRINKIKQIEESINV